MMKIIKFINSNYLYLLWFLVYFTTAWVLFGADINSFVLVSIVYGVSLTIALSPIGEMILILMENCRKPATEQERDYLLPMFDEVFQNAKEVDPKLNNGMKLYIMDAMYVNAFAIGRKTIAVTKGAIQTFTADELKGILAHELGHMSYGHTKALLLSVIGNAFFSVIAWIFKTILLLMQFISNIMTNSNIVGIIFSVIRFFIDLIIFVFIHLSQIILALNSRTNEIQADNFAHEIGYGRELISAFYLLQKISMNSKLKLLEQMKSSHPHLARRIENLERLESQTIAV